MISVSLKCFIDPTKSNENRGTEPAWVDVCLYEDRNGKYPRAMKENCRWRRVADSYPSPTWVYCTDSKWPLSNTQVHLPIRTTRR
ncbi:hypothetical protein TNCT_652851 [Trichonephila clavata]|uniref:Uncharacterized protein n=1 Tax=Trichonephila clavata TaxID=2740835 RepID=A0A8X6H6V9_TRICU|nr:hypothetical protein TNCT_652851 [Trichonephila clavata]